MNQSSNPSVSHTPGPWTYDYSPNHSGMNPSFLVMTTDNTIVAEVARDPERGVLGGIVEANAQLIAAAPDMLEALKRVVAEWLIADYDPVGELVRAAIEKAEGRTESFIPSVDGPALPSPDEPEARVAEPTGGTPVAAYAGPADSGVSATTAAPHLCETCGARPVHRSNHEARSHWCLECQIDGSVPLPKHRFDDGPAMEPMPPTYCFRSFCICCGRGGEYITRQRKPVQGARRCAHCNGRMIVEFT